MNGSPGAVLKYRNEKDRKRLFTTRGHLPL